MDPRSGEVFEHVDMEEAKRRKLVRIPDAKLEEVKAMTTEQRITWAAARKRDAAERKARRRAAKKARRKRRGRR